MCSLEKPATGRYLVELYVPRQALSRLEADVARIAEVAAGLAGQGLAVRHLRSLFVPADEVCFHVFEASGFEAVEQALRCAGVEHERLSEAIDLAGGRDS